MGNYVVITPEGEQITVEEYMKTEDGQRVFRNKIKETLAIGLSDEQKAELSKLYIK